MRILVLNGPNLNLLGHAGTSPDDGMSLNDMNKALATYGAEEHDGLELVFYQTNHEGQLIDMVQKAALQYDGMILNPAALCHYSYALRDAVELAGLPVVEVHLTDLRKEEGPRSRSVIAEACEAQFMGSQLDSYREALDYLMGS